MAAALLDTSVVVRYLTGAPARLAARAARIIDTDRELAVTDVVIAEAAYVLSTVYGVPREAIVDGLVAFLQRRNVVTLGLDRGAVIQALLLCGPSKRVSFADAMIWAAARSARAGVGYSFDERFPGTGVDARRDAPR
jgi:predicted nucleic acid-binding protein